MENLRAPTPTKEPKSPPSLGAEKIPHAPKAPWIPRAAGFLSDHIPHLSAKTKRSQIPSHRRQKKPPKAVCMAAVCLYQRRAAPGLLLNPWLQWQWVETPRVSPISTEHWLAPVSWRTSPTWKSSCKLG